MTIFNLFCLVTCALLSCACANSILAKLEENSYDVIRKLIEPCHGEIDCEYDVINSRLQSDPEFVKHFPYVNDVTNDGVELEASGKVPNDVKTRNKRSVMTCPVMNEGYLSRAKEHMDRSTSPWTWVENRDDNRVPQILAETDCLCNGCVVNLASGMEDPNLSSQPITVDRAVLYKVPGGGFRKGVATLNYGCRCDFPIVTTLN